MSAEYDFQPVIYSVNKKQNIAHNSMHSVVNKIWLKIDSSLLRLFSYLPKYRYLLAGAVACMLVAAASSSLVAYLRGTLT